MTMRPTTAVRQFQGNATGGWSGWVMPARINQGPARPVVFKTFRFPPREWGWDFAPRWRPSQTTLLHRAIRFLMAPNCKGGLR